MVAASRPPSRATGVKLDSASTNSPAASDTVLMTMARPDVTIVARIIRLASPDAPLRARRMNPTIT